MCTFSVQLQNSLLNGESLDSLLIYGCWLCCLLLALAAVRLSIFWTVLKIAFSVKLSSRDMHTTTLSCCETNFFYVTCFECICVCVCKVSEWRRDCKKRNRKKNEFPSPTLKRSITQVWIKSNSRYFKFLYEIIVCVCFACIDPGDLSYCGENLQDE